MPNYGTLTRSSDNNQIQLTLGGAGGDDNEVNVQYNFYQNRFYGGPEYVHYKTNIPYSGWTMHNIEAVGYNYGTNLPIRCTWCFHISYNSGPHNVSLSNSYSGLSANRVYISSDNYVVIVAYAASQYYAGWSFNSYSVNPTGPFEVSILAVVMASTNDNAF